ncbi:MAG: SUMF1/EgtB/PvdO family nonheme iron enzyme [Bacteroidetes bacterium]|nr:SUMF1/EgtB/PvdO family nonheme iron enzyme [Bacteroidota bacterium]MCB0843136.1 SUMF1/EgtB/PvdO family nonheme iron enzyme [Bacteroidota bacterium]
MAKDRKITFQETTHNSTPSGKNYLLVIGINQYQHFSPLNNAVRDAETIRDLLLENYQFEEKHTISLLDQEATRENILESLYELEDQITTKDNLLLYFAGHGMMNAQETQGFWIPVEAQEKRSQYIANTRIRDILKDIRSHHTYLIVDSCFSGSMILRGKNQTEDLITILPSRRVLTSGRKQVVSDGPKGGHSPFAKCIIEYLKNKPGEGISALDLEYHVQKNTPRTAKQHPEAAFIFGLGDQSGQFVFTPKHVVKEITWEELAGNMEACRTYVKDYPQGQWEETAYWEIASLADTLRDYQAYARKFLRGKYINQALEKIESLEEKEAYETAEKRGWIALVRFINQYPDSQYVAKAEEEIQRLTQKQKEPEVEKVEPKIVIKEERKKPESKNQKPLKGPIEMVFVEGGTFMMGSEEGYEREKPVHKVKLSSFYIGKYPVTQKQWEEVMGDNPSNFKDCPDCPVEQVSWNEAHKFIEKINQKYSGLNYRLLTEAEWEFAARGGNKSGNYLYSGSKNLDEVGWYYQNANKKTHPVGQKKPNELGIYDMSGNVWEWCSDWYGGDYYQTCFDIGLVVNPIGPEKGDIRVIRGGSWYDDSHFCRSSDRLSDGPDDRIDVVGFRLAASPSQ